MAFTSFVPIYPPAVAPAPLHNPAVPVIAPVPKPMQVGQIIRIKGTILPYAPKFHFNLSTAPALDAPTYLHFNPRFDGVKSEVVRNTCYDEKWGKEEKTGPKEFDELKKNGEYPLPISPGGPFEILILVHSDCYKIALNGIHFCEFEHRYDKDEVSHLIVEGAVTVESIAFEGALPHMRGVAPPSGPPKATIPVPCKRDIPGGLHPDKIIYISGAPHGPSYEKFSINFMLTQETNIDIAFHFNARFDGEDGDGYVVRNSLTGVTWEKEDRTKPKLARNSKAKLNYPFTPGQYFDMAIVVEKEGYKVAVNGQHFCDYQHKIKDLGRIKFLEIEGDVHLCNVTIA